MMKKLCCVFLTILMALSLFACGNQEAEEEKAAWSGSFAAGFGRADITPPAACR